MCFGSGVTFSVGPELATVLAAESKPSLLGSPFRLDPVRDVVDGVVATCSRCNRSLRCLAASKADATTCSVQLGHSEQNNEDQVGAHSPCFWIQMYINLKPYLIMICSQETNSFLGIWPGQHRHHPVNPPWSSDPWFTLARGATWAFRKSREVTRSHAKSRKVTQTVYECLFSQPTFIVTLFKKANIHRSQVTRSHAKSREVTRDQTWSFMRLPVSRSLDSGMFCLNDKHILS